MREKLKHKLCADCFELIADAAAAAMFHVDGREDNTPSAKVVENEIIATRTFKARLRKELTARNFGVLAKPRSGPEAR